MLERIDTPCGGSALKATTRHTPGRFALIQVMGANHAPRSPEVDPLNFSLCRTDREQVVSIDIPQGRLGLLAWAAEQMGVEPDDHDMVTDVPIDELIDTVASHMLACHLSNQEGA